MTGGTVGMAGGEAGPRWPARVHPTPANFTAELRHIRLQAGEPSYREISRRAGRRYSPATIWRAFTQDKLPQWPVAAAILQALGVADRTSITAWREMWARAHLEEMERRDGDGVPDPRQAAAADPAPGTPAEGPRRLTALTAPTADGPDLAAGQVCDDCGALIGDLIPHQAWHWRVERQLRGATLRAVEGTGQLTRSPEQGPVSA